MSRKIDAQSARATLCKQKLDEAENLRNSLSSSLQQKRISVASLEPLVDAKQAKYEKLKNDLSLLAPTDEENHVTEEIEVDDTVVRLNAAYASRDSITSNIKSKREERANLNQNIDRKEQQLRQIRKDQERYVASSNAIKVDQGRLETKLETNLQRLASEYQLTYEFAKTKVSELNVENAKEEVLQLRSISKDLVISI